MQSEQIEASLHPVCSLCGKKIASAWLVFQLLRCAGQTLWSYCVSEAFPPSCVCKVDTLTKETQLSQVAWRLPPNLLHFSASDTCQVGNIFIERCSLTQNLSLLREHLFL